MDYDDIRRILNNSAINTHFKIVLAYVVIAELDKIKNDPKRDEDTREKAKIANKQIRHLQLMEHESFECQVRLCTS